MGFSVAGPLMGDAEWSELRTGVAKLLVARKRPQAAELLIRYPFQVHEGENDFGDEFCVLYAEVALPVYVEIEEINRSLGGREQFASIARTITELGRFIRFVAVEMVLEDGPNPVPNPTPASTTQVVERALVESEQLLNTAGPISAVDRVHTALHGYLRDLCIRLSATNQAVTGLDITQLFRRLRTTPVFNQSIHSQHAERLGQALATILDALNPMRNRGSMAHANPVLLTEAEAMRAINAARSILHYLDALTR